MVYRSTGSNTFFCYSNNDGIGFGADNHFGLFIEESLSKGSTHECKTYANELLSSKDHFTIKRLEVFGFKHNIY